VCCEKYSKLHTRLLTEGIPGLQDLRLQSVAPRSDALFVLQVCSAWEIEGRDLTIPPFDGWRG
jgi:hypothetical protein